MSIKRQLYKFLFGPERGVLGRIKTPYWNGLRIATVGGLTAFIGAAIVAMELEEFGKVVVVAGILTSLMGIGYHFILMVIWFTQGRKGKGD
jgi:hypothetical protein